MAKKKVEEAVVLEEKTKKEQTEKDLSKTKAIRQIELKDDKTEKEVEIKEEKDVKETPKKRENLDAEIKMMEKKEKKSSFWKEVKAFFILLIIIALLSLGGWYWYTHYRDIEDKKTESKVEETKTENYKTIKYTVASDHSLKVLNDKYVIEYDEDYIYKVMDMDTQVLYEGEEEYSNYYVGIDDKFYISLVGDADNENIVSLYVVENEKMVEVKEITTSGVYYQPLVYLDKNHNYYELIGFAGSKTAFDEELNEISNAYIQSIEGIEYVLSDSVITGEYITENQIISYDYETVIVKDTQSGLYGLYSLDSKDYMVKPQYDSLNKDRNNYIASKNFKYGIITTKLKKVLDFEYDFIDAKEDFYVVCKDNKMALMSKDYKVFTKYDFDYQVSNGGVPYMARKVNDKYILTINANEYKNHLTYDKHETYFISENGNYVTVVANDFSSENDNLLYSYNSNDKQFVIYNSELNEKFKIDISNYDFSGVAEISLHYNTVELKMDSSIYYDYETGEEIDGYKDYEIEIGDLKVKYNANQEKVSYVVDGSEIASLDVRDIKDDRYYKKLNDSDIYYETDTDYVVIRKGN